MQTCDVVIVGAGAAGLFCAGVAGQLGLSVLLIDHSQKVAEKIRISGGGRSNFTNQLIDASAPQKHFLSENPHFCRSALSRYTAQDFIQLVQSYQISFHEKHKGQLFCDRSAEDLIQMLLRECDKGGVKRLHGCGVRSLTSGGSSYKLETDQGEVQTSAVVIATGGLSIPQIGATDFGYRIAQQYGLRLVARRPGLVPLTFNGTDWAPYASLAGLALPVSIETGIKKAHMRFDEDLLFTHRGLSGPAVLQISNYWQEGQPLHLNLAPQENIEDALMHAKVRSKKLIANELGAWVPHRLAEAWVAQDPQWQRPVAEASDKALLQLAQKLSHWPLTPQWQRGLQKSRSDFGRGGYPRLVVANHGIQAAGPLFHRGSGRCHRVAWGV